MLYTSEEAVVERPLVLNMSFISLTPQMGISFTDAGGAQRFYSINESGMDGSVMLSEMILTE